MKTTFSFICILMTLVLSLTACNDTMSTPVEAGYYATVSLPLDKTPQIDQTFYLKADMKNLSVASVTLHVKAEGFTITAPDGTVSRDECIYTSTKASGHRFAFRYTGDKTGDALTIRFSGSLTGKSGKTENLSITTVYAYPTEDWGKDAFQLSLEPLFDVPNNFASEVPINAEIENHD